MTLKKAIEIGELNLKLAGSTMPPDTRNALTLLIGASKSLIRNRSSKFIVIPELLRGETES